MASTETKSPDPASKDSKGRDGDKKDERGKRDKRDKRDKKPALTVEVRPDGIAVVTFDVPGEAQNTLRAEFAAEFNAVLDELEGGAVRAAVLVSGKPDTFVAGADIAMIQGVASAAEAEALARQGQEAFSRLAELGKPVVAAVHGPCLGGGFELALACTARICSDSPKTVFGLPEVQLGLLPGAGGTQRLPRLIGIQAALDLLLTGRQVRARKALKLGIVSEVVRPSILREVAIGHAQRLVTAPRTRSAGERLGDALRELTTAQGAQRLALEENPLGRRVLFGQARKQLLEKTLGNYPAAERIVDVVELGMDKGLRRGLDAEARAFGELVVSPVARALMGIFFATQALKKDTGVDDAGVSPRPVKRVGILGAGLMGAGIAFVSVDKADLEVRLKDVSDEGVARGLATVKGLLDKRVRRKATTRAEAERQLRRVTGSVDLSGFAACDVVIEAVFEDLALKHRMIQELEALGNERLIFASNTSSIPIGRLAAAARHPENVIGLHYFSPVEKMPLLEIIVTEQTSDEVTATCVELGKRQGKTVIVVRDGVGFYTSRILAPYMNEAARLLSEGVPVEVIDRALKQWGYPVGPITLLDEVGIDVAAKVGPIMIEAYGERMTPPPVMERLLADERKGRKNRRGFYVYGEDEGKKKGGGGKEVDQTVYEVLGIEPRTKMDPTELAERCALLMVNEAIYCLQEGILRSPRDGDIGAIFGLGFPPFRGGPFRYADALGAAALVEKLEGHRRRQGERFAPAALLVEMARDGRRFHGD